MPRRPRSQPNIGRAAVQGGLIGFAVVAALVTALVLLAGGGPEALGVGVFVGFFGGTGFGAMLAASVSADRLAKHEDSQRSSSGSVRAAK